MPDKLAFEVKYYKTDGIYYGKLYIKTLQGEKDVSEIMVKMGKAFTSNSMNQLANATIESSDPEYVEAVPKVQQNENEIVQLSVTEQISKSEDDSSSTVSLVSNQTVEKLETRINDASDDSDWESKLLSVCSDDSVKTEEIRETATLDPTNDSADQSNVISSGKCIDDIPAYLLEDEISEVGAGKYSVPRNGDLFKETERNDDIDEMRKLLKSAKLLNNTFKLPFIHYGQLSRLMFHPRVNKHLTQIRCQDPNHIQEKMWSIISKAAVKNIHIVGDTHYVMYLPSICDSIYVSFCHSLIVVNNRLSVSSPILIIFQKLQFQRQKGIPWKGPEALIVVSDTKEAKEVHKFCSIILGTNAVCLDLNTPSDKLSIKVKINSFVCCS